jgi:hypothetical protein
MEKKVGLRVHRALPKQSRDPKVPAFEYALQIKIKTRNLVPLEIGD